MTLVEGRYQKIGIASLAVTSFFSSLSYLFLLCLQKENTLSHCALVNRSGISIKSRFASQILNVGMSHHKDFR